MKKIMSIGISLLMLVQPVYAQGLPKGSSEIPETKEETVNVKTDASGKVKETKVSVLLKNDTDTTYIKDRTTLKDIKNSQGDEEFYEDNGYVLWDNHNEDIHYQGTTTKELPVDVKISYYLEGEKIDPQDLVGKSGSVKIRFDYKNKEKRTVKVKGKNYSVYVPFAAISMVLLDSDIFSNVEVDNGKLVSMEGQNIAMGLAFPGLEKSLHISNIKDLDIDVPDYFEIEADVKDFKLDFSATMLSSGLLKDLDLDSLDNMDDLFDGMKQLQDASSKLVKGATQLSQGTSKYGKYLNQYFKGVEGLSKGNIALSQAMTKVEKQVDSYQPLFDAINRLESKLEKEIEKDKSIDLTKTSELLLKISEDQDKYKAQLTNLVKSMTALSQYKDSIDKQLETLSQIDFNNIEDTLKSNTKTNTKDKVSKVLENIELSDEEKESILKAIDEGVDESIDLSTQASSFTTAMKQLQTISSNLDLSMLSDKDIQSSVKELQIDINSLSKIFDTLSKDKQVSKDVKTLEKYLNKLTEEDVDTTDVQKQVKTLTTALKQLEKGSKQLKKATPQLSKSYNALVKGTSQLAKGIKLFDSKGISKLSELSDSELSDVLNRLDALKKADNYDSFSGKYKGQDTSVKFVIETEELK